MWRTLTITLALILVSGCATLRDGPIPGRDDTMPYPTVASLPDFPVEFTGCPPGELAIAGDFAHNSVDYRLTATKRRFMLIDFTHDRVWLGTVDGDRFVVTSTLTLPEAARTYPSPCDFLAPEPKGLAA